MRLAFMGILLLFSSSVMANNDGPTQAYLNKRYEQAKDGFYQLVQLSPNHFSHHYNLGASYFRLNRPIESKHHFLKALKLKPNDADTQFNLSLINKKLIDQQFIFEQHFLHVLGINFKSILSLMLIVSAILIGSLSIIHWETLSKKNQRLGIVFLFVWSTLQVLVIGINLNLSEFGLIVDKKTQVYSGPSKTQKPLFYAHEGAEFKIIKETKRWTNVQFPNGLKGWVSNNSSIHI